LLRSCRNDAAYGSSVHSPVATRFEATVRGQPSRSATASTASSRSSSQTASASPATASPVCQGIASDSRCARRSSIRSPVDPASAARSRASGARPSASVPSVAPRSVPSSVPWRDRATAAMGTKAITVRARRATPTVTAAPGPRNAPARGASSDAGATTARAARTTARAASASAVTRCESTEGRNESTRARRTSTGDSRVLSVKSIWRGSSGEDPPIIPHPRSRRGASGAPRWRPP